MKALLVGILGAVTACVLPPPIQFFTPLPSGQEIIGPLTDTVLVLRHGNPDSVSSDGVWLALILAGTATLDPTAGLRTP